MDRARLIDEHDKVTEKLLYFLVTRNQNLRKYGTDDLIYMAEADIISIIGDNPDISASDIALKLSISKSAVSKTVNRMFGKGLITKVTPFNDTRKFLLNLTPRGRTIYEYHKRIDDDVLDSVLEELSSCTDEEIMGYIKIAQIHINVLYEKIGTNDK